MEKLSRTVKYKNYRDGINSDSEREIATKELRDFQNKIIFNEKRFGNSSRTENDLNRGRKDTSYDNFYDNYYGSLNETFHTPDKKEYESIDDIFGEIDKYKKEQRNHDNENVDEFTNNNDRQNSKFDDKDEYIKKIREIVNNAGGQSQDPVHHEVYSREDRYNVERTFEREKFANQDIINREDKYNEIIQQKQELDEEYNHEQEHTSSLKQNQEVITPSTEENATSVSFEEQKVDNIQEAEFVTEQEHVQEQQLEIGFNVSEEDKEEEIELDFNAPNNEQEQTVEPVVQEEPEVEDEPYVSPMANIKLEKPEIKQLVPQRDESNEFKEICDNANALADEIDAANSFGENTYVPNAVSHVKNNSLEGLQNDINKDLINSKTVTDFMQAIELEVNQYNDEEASEEPVEEPKEEDVEEQKTAPKKSEVSEEMKEVYDNTVSFEVNKLMNEINASKNDDISVDEIIKGNDHAKKDFDDTHLGKTIAFDIDDNSDILDNTIVLSKPEDLEDTSIHTMSFKTEELDEKDEKNNVLLNIILTVLIIIAIAALGVMAYFFLITRGII